MRPRLLPALLLTLAGLAGPAGAQEGPPHSLSEGGRYQLMDINDKIVRLDTQTGAFDLCRMETEGWNCRMAEDERRLLSERIDALEARVAALESAGAGPQQMAQATQETPGQAIPEPEAAAEKGFVERVYDYVPGIGW